MTERSAPIPTITQEFLEASLQQSEAAHTQALKDINKELAIDQTPLSRYIASEIIRYSRGTSMLYATTAALTLGWGTRPIRSLARLKVVEALTAISQQSRFDMTGSIENAQLRDFIPTQIPQTTIDSAVEERDSEAGNPPIFARLSEILIQNTNPLLAQAIDDLTERGTTWDRGRRGRAETLPVEAGYVATYAALAVIRAHNLQQR